MNICALILAAGKSQRMGRHKALLQIHGKTFIEHLTAMFAPYVSKTFIVVSAELYQQIHSLQLNLPNSQLIINQHPEKGRFLSVLTGLKYINTHTFLHNVDMPLIKSDTIYKLMQLVNSNQTIIPKYQNRNGHPVLIGKNIVNYLKQQTPDQNLKNLLRAKPYKTITVDDQGVIININTPVEYSHFINKISKI